MQRNGDRGNPLLKWRLGKCKEEIGEKEQADDELTSEYDIEGEEMYSEDDKK